MLKKVYVKSDKSENNKCNSHVANKFKVIISNFKEKKQTEIWPESFNPFISDQKTFPLSLFVKSAH